VADRPVTGFTLSLPANGEELRANVRHALSLGLPELHQMPPRPDPVAVIGNGPSARNFQRWDWDRLKRRHIAVNGAGRLFGKKGPTWWAACDPQPLVADFFAEPPQETTYLIASKCHPSVFEALADRDVLLWHVGSEATLDLLGGRQRPVRLVPTITLCALELAERLGYSKVETWGWDGCYLDGRNHAVEQEHCGDGNCDIEVGDQTFRSTRNWMFEAVCAVQRFDGVARDITVHGGGMFEAWLRGSDLIAGA
jgi:hypothetical protein